LDTPSQLKLSGSPLNASAKNIAYTWGGVPSAGRYYLLIGSSTTASCNPNYSPSLSSPLALFYKTIISITFHACAKVQAYPLSTDTVHTKSNFTDVVIQ
jgi:hypothetical protein